MFISRRGDDGGSGGRGATRVPRRRRTVTVALADDSCDVTRTMRWQMAIVRLSWLPWDGPVSEMMAIAALRGDAGAGRSRDPADSAD